MANARIRPSALYVNGDKLATLSGSTFDFNSNDQRQLVIDGYLGHSDGIEVTDTEAKIIIPVGDVTIDEIVRLLQDKEYLEVQGTVGDKLVSITSRCVSFNVTSEVESGKLEGTFKFEGGKASFV